jgi:hypothetical protein
MANKKGRPGRSQPAKKSARVLYQDLTARQRKIREKALHAIARSRRKGIPLRIAAREEGVSMRSVAKYVPAAIKRDKSGVQVATKGDRYRRNMTLPSPLGDIPISVYSSREASLLTKYRLALAEYARTGDEQILRPFQGQTVNGNVLVTDPGQLIGMLGAGEFRPDRLYAAIGGAA